MDESGGKGHMTATLSFTLTSITTLANIIALNYPKIILMKTIII